MPLFKKDHTFHDLLDAQAEAAYRAATAYHTLVTDFPRAVEHAEAIDRIESEADTLAHTLANRIDATFVTPLDKEDLRTLAHLLDDVTDLIDAGAARVCLYQITEPRPDLESFVAILVETTQAMRKAVKSMRNLKARKDMQSLLISIHELENKGDRAYREAMGSLFNAPDADALSVIKWKEVYDRIEWAVDKCEDIANMVESVVVKYA